MEPQLLLLKWVIPDLIDHKLNGYLAKCYNTTELMEGIVWFKKSSKKDFKKNCLEKFIKTLQQKS